MEPGCSKEWRPWGGRFPDTVKAFRYSLTKTQKGHRERDEGVGKTAGGLVKICVMKSLEAGWGDRGDRSRG